MGWLSSIMDKWFGMDPPPDPPPIIPLIQKQYLGSFAQIRTPEGKEQKKVRNIAKERRRRRGTTGKRTLMIAPDESFVGMPITRITGARTVNY